MLAHPHPAALVAMPIPSAALPLELRVLEAESAVEAAEQVWAMRARDLDARPSEQTLRLQSYPAGFEWCGTKTKRFLQIGNAVPPLMAEAIIRAAIS